MQGRFYNAKSALEKNLYAITEFNLLQQEDITAVCRALIAAPGKEIPEKEQRVVKIPWPEAAR